MSKNKTLSAAKSAKNDEFYTQYAVMVSAVPLRAVKPAVRRGEDGGARQDIRPRP